LIIIANSTPLLGAVVQQWPAPFSVWSEDSSQESGYKLLKSSATDPTREELDELFDVSGESLCLLYTNSSLLFILLLIGTGDIAERNGYIEEDQQCCFRVSEWHHRLLQGNVAAINYFSNLTQHTTHEISY